MIPTKSVSKVILIGSLVSLAITVALQLSPVVKAQTNTTGTISAMTEFARQHLRAADTALLNNDTATARDLLTLAELQIALIGMEPEGTMTEAQLSEFMQRDTMSDSDASTDYCLMNIDGVVQCGYPSQYR